MSEWEDALEEREKLLGGYTYEKAGYKPGVDTKGLRGLSGVAVPADINIIPANGQPIDAINQAVLNKIINRAIQGMKTYGVSMERTDVSTVEWLKHLQEELLDGAVYLERVIRDLTKKG